MRTPIGTQGVRRLFLMVKVLE